MSEKKPLSAAQLAANRANAKKSTGPRSIEGKKRSSANSWQHGLTGATALLPSDNRDAYEEYVTGIVGSLHPGSLLEHEICRDVADAHWRLRRAFSVESKMLTLPAKVPPPPKSSRVDNFHNQGPAEPWEPIPYVFPTEEIPWSNREQDLGTAARVCLDAPNALTNIALYEQRIHRNLKNSMQELRRLQSEREARLKSELPEALKHYNFQRMHDLPFIPADHGFVSSFAAIDLAFNLEILRTHVKFADIIKFDLPKYENKYPKRAA